MKRIVFCAGLIAVFGCTKTDDDPICEEDHGSFIYAGESLDSNFHWHDGIIYEEDVYFLADRRWPMRDSLLGFWEVLSLNLPLRVGKVDLGPITADYAHVYQDWIGKPYGYDPTYDNTLEVLSVDTTLQRISARFDLHFVLEGDTIFPPFAKQVSFTEGFICLPYKKFQRP